MTKIIEDDYTRKYLPELIGKTLIPTHWDSEDEDSIWIDCVEDPKLSGWIYYANLEDWTINGNT